MSPPSARLIVTALVLGSSVTLAADAARTLTIDGAFAAERAAPARLRGGAGKTAWSVDLVHLPGGTFTMGALPGEGGNPKDGPARDVTVASFWMADVETPWGLFERFCDPAEKAAWPSSDWVCPMADTKDTKVRRADLPVVNVTWWEAVAFCNWLTTAEFGAGEQVYVVTGTGDARTVAVHLDRKGYRLPTEAEWEWAARAGSATNKYSGYSLASWGCDYANTLDDDDCYRGSADIFDGASPARPPSDGAKGDFKPNAWGLYQMSGNVQEWVHDAVPDNKGVSDRLRVFRGGSWDLARLIVNSTEPDLKRTIEPAWVFYLGADLPERRRPDHGFRIARSG